MKNLFREYLSIDYFRLVAALLVVAIHTSPLTDFSGTADFIFTRVLGRVAVPFFFMASAFFLYTKATDGRLPYSRLSRFVRKTAVLYSAAILFYLPLNFYNGSATEWSAPSAFVKDLLFDGTFYHLWYLPASIFGAFLCWQLLERLKPWQALFIAMLLYGVGLFGDSYYGITERLPLMESCYQQLFQFFDYTRNGFFFAPVFFVMGSLLAVRPAKKRFLISFSSFIASLAMMLAEGLLLHNMKLQRHDSMYVMLIPCMYFLFQCLLSLGQNRKPSNPNLPYYLRTISIILYVIHPAMIVVVRGIAKAIHMEQLLVQNSLVHYIMTALFSFGVSWMIAFLLKYKHFHQAGARIPDVNAPHRAWIEVTLPNLLHNVEVLKGRLPKDCQIMPVIKANAYGHGSKEVAAFLEKSGINSFAVATAEEGIELRRAGVKGDILILGFTHAGRAAELCSWRLTQTAVDVSHAKELNDALNDTRRYSWSRMNKRPLRLSVHLKIDTGMHRLGEAYQNQSDMKDVFSLKNLEISGIYTHLCSSDCSDASSVHFTQQQIQRFSKLSEELKNQGIPLPGTHVFSSYGAVNYGASQEYSYARVGIALYGVLSTPALPTDFKDRNTPTADRTLSLKLKPVLSLKARVALIRTVDPEEGVGYGLDYTAHQETRIAVVSIGYADGYPRSLSGKGFALVHGTRVPVIGRICMDQLMIDVTGLSEVERGDIVTLIGRDGCQEITAEQTADAADTITNELLSRLGSRLETVYLSD